MISFAFEQRGNSVAAKKVWGLGKYGTSLAQYLVNIHKWGGIYINPDVSHPVDWDSEHTYSAYLANKNCSYYGIALDYKVTNYAVTPTTHAAYKKLNKNKGVITLDSVSISNLEKVKFGFGVSKGGQHTWLFSKGDVYEVHWDQVGSSLYEASPLKTYLSMD